MIPKRHYSKGAYYKQNPLHNQDYGKIVYVWMIVLGSFAGYIIFLTISSVIFFYISVCNNQS